MADSKIDIYVFAHWEKMTAPKLMGVLGCSEVRGKEVFSFEYDDKWLKEDQSFLLDPGLHNYPGPQYVYNDQANFGIFTDSSPDRWGRMLIKRRESFYAKKENRDEM